MRVTKLRILAALLLLAMAAHGARLAGQISPSASGEQSAPVPALRSSSTAPAPNSLPPVDPALSLSSPASQPLFDFKDSDIKFNLSRLMSTLRDSRHEGWVLTAYPDPNTSRPLIGAGFSLDVTTTEHIQRDPLNPNQFIEPSSTQLWQAAGLDPERLQKILDQFDRNLKVWKKKNYRKKIQAHVLPPQITEDEATQLLRISAIQAIHNARAYCRDFDWLTASEQMALSQLVFQMGVNLEEFVEFLAALNDSVNSTDTAQPDDGIHTAEVEHWKTIQRTLIESQWARRYTNRAAAVIAMFDPDYVNDPKGAERRVEATLRPPARHRGKKSPAKSVRAGSDGSL
jgi:hypothetical protein